MKKSLLIAVVVVFLATSIGMAFAGPFSDVPKKHWAYEAVNSLAAKGLLEGYADGKFKGAKAMTRYEMALMVARLIDKKFGGADLETLQKLTIEFADELALLGVKVQALEEEVKVMRNDVDAAKADIDMLKKGGLGKIKLSVEDRIRWEQNKSKSLNAAVGFNRYDVTNDSRMVNRLRMNMKANIDDNVSAFFSYQDSTVHGSNVQNNAFNGRNNVADTTNRSMFLGYIDVKNFGGNNIIDNFRAGRFTLTLGKGFILDNEIDGLQMKKNYKGTNFSLAAFDTRAMVTLAVPPAINNDGLDAKLVTVDHAWKNVAAGLYYMTRSNTFGSALVGNSALNIAGLTLDGKIGKNIVAFVEYADQKAAKNKTNYAVPTWSSTGVPTVNPDFKGKGFKVGGEWTINPTWDLTLLYQNREKDFTVLGINDDYSDSAYAGNSAYSTTFDKNCAGLATTLPALCTLPLGTTSDNYNNSKIASFIIGYKATNKLHLDVWYEDFKGKDSINCGNLGGVATGALVATTGNFDQNTVQLVGTYQYRENTAFKLRYRTTKYKSGDNDYAILGTAAPADHDQVRLDLNVKF